MQIKIPEKCDSEITYKMISNNRLLYYFISKLIIILMKNRSNATIEVPYSPKDNLILKHVDPHKLRIIALTHNT